MINILIIDTHYTDRIAETLMVCFEGKVQCFTGHVPNDKEINLFIISGRMIIESKSTALEFKERFGSSNAKVLAISTVDGTLDEINNNPNLGVDFTLSKQMIMDLSFKCLHGNIQERVTDAQKSLQHILDTWS